MILRNKTCGRNLLAESNQLDNFNRQLKFLKISLATYIKNKQYIEF